MLQWLLHRLTMFFDRRDDPDQFLGHPQTQRFQSLVAQKQWQELESAYAALRVDERHIILEGLVDAVEQEDVFDEWLQTSQSATAHLFKGALLIVLGWRIRTGKRAKDVPREAARKFLEYLQEASEPLQRAVELAEQDAEPRMHLIRVMLGLGADPDDFREAFAGLRDTGQFHLRAACTVLEALSAKWYGSEEMMFEFARSAAAADPRYHSLMTFAHAEAWLQQDDEASDGYFKRPYVVKEIRDAHAADQLLRGSELEYAVLLARNGYAFAFHQMQEHALAAAELRVIDQRATVKPWGYLSGDAFNAARVAGGLPKVSQ